jgi:adenosine deaminase
MYKGIKGINTLEEYMIEPYSELIESIVRYLYYDNVNEALARFNNISIDQKNMWYKGVYTALKGTIESFRRNNHSKPSLIERALKTMKIEEIKLLIDIFLKRLNKPFTDDFDRGYIITMVIILNEIIKLKEQKLSK